MKLWKRTLGLFLLLAVLVLVLPTNADAAEVASGKCGDDLTWVLTDDGTLTISGTGEMTDYDEGTAPWYVDRYSIQSVVIGDGVTSIGQYAFFDCIYLTSIEIPASVTQLGGEAFTNVGYEDVEFGTCYYCHLYFAGSVEFDFIIDYWLLKAHYNCTDIASHWELKEYPATCNLGGYLVDECACGHTLAREYISDPLGHDYAYTVLEPTCLEGGYTTVSCSRCTLNYKTNYTDALGHALEEDSCTRCGVSGDSVDASGTCGRSLTWELTANGTLTVSGTGYMTYYDRYTVAPEEELTFAPWLELPVKKVVIADGVTSIGSYAFIDMDSIEEVSIADSVTAIGSGAFYGCGGLMTVVMPASVTTVANNAFDYMPYDYGDDDCFWADDADRHYWDLYYGGTQEAFDALGISFNGDDWSHHRVHYECTQPEGHWTETVTPTTCTARGYTTHSCPCGNSYIDNYTAVLGHDYAAEVKAPTCTEEGYTNFTCTVCGDCYTGEYIEAAGHNCTEEVVAPTCTKGGHTTYTCTVCGFSETGNYTEPLGSHSYTEKVVAPTCTGEGYTTYMCTVCGDTYTDNYTEPVDHDGIATAVLAPTCTEGGYTTYTCAVCGFIYTDNYTDPLGHDYAAKVVAPTCMMNGYTTYTCTGCGESYTDNYTEPAEHDYKAMQVFEPTCTEGGYTEYTCAYCGTMCDGDYTDPLGHTYEKGFCVDCGESDPDYVAIAAPVVKAANITASGKIKVSWNKVSGATKYMVYRSTSKNSGYSRLITTTKTYVNNTSAEVGKTYYYYVVAVDADGNKSEKSNIAYRCCDLAQPVIKLTNVASTGKIKVSWEKIEGATKYEVYRATSKSGTYKRIITTKNLYVLNKSTDAGTTYYYKVRALCGNSSATSAFSAIGYRCCDLARPEITVTLNTKGKPVIQWDAVEGAIKYEVWYATSKNGTYKRLITTTKTSITNSSAVAGTTNYYKVRAVCGVSSATSAYSAVKYIKAK